MSTTRSQKRRNVQQEISNTVCEGLISPVLSEDDTCVAQDVQEAGPSNPESPRIENSIIERLRISLKDEITSEIKNLLVESQKEMLSLLKFRANANSREEPENKPENETRSFYTPTKSVRINTTQNNHPCNSRNSNNRQMKRLKTSFATAERANKALQSGIFLGNLRMQPENDNLVPKNIQCYKCFEIGQTGCCSARIDICSICAEQGQAHKNCKKKEYRGVEIVKGTT